MFTLKDLQQLPLSQAAILLRPNLLDDKTCLICGGRFIGETERMNAVISGQDSSGNFLFSHAACWREKGYKVEGNAT